MLARGLDFSSRLWRRIREAHHLLDGLTGFNPTISVVCGWPVVGCNRRRILRLDRLADQRLSPIFEDATPVSAGIEAADQCCYAQCRPSNCDADDSADSHGIQNDDRGSGCSRGASDKGYCIYY